MIRFLGELPRDITVACSGGIDSMVVLDFLRTGKRKVKVAYFNHGTDFSNEMEPKVENFCRRNGIGFIKGDPYRGRDKKESLEEYWRNARYKFLLSIEGLVITAHHLDDVVETYLFTSIHGTPKTIPYRYKNIIRPFLITPKSEFISWAERKGVEYWDDPSNDNTSFARNRIRHNIMPEVLKINPGIHKVVKKLVLKDYSENN